MTEVTGAITQTVALINGGLGLFTTDSFFGGAIAIALVATLMVAFAGGVLGLASRRKGKR